MTIEIFQGHNVRIEAIDGKVWFALTDIATVLGSQNSRQIAQRIKEKDVRNIYTPTNGGKQELKFVNERGLIRILQTSRSPLAEPFQDWADERVEQLMNGQTVNASGVVNHTPTGAELMALALIEASKTLEAKDKEIEQMKPAVAKHDAFLDSDRQLLISSVAKAYKAKGVHIGRSFSEVLKNLGLIYLASQPESKRKKWRANTEAVRQGLLVEVDRSTNGYTRIDIRVTPKGFFDIYDRLCKMQGVKPYPKAELAEELIQED